MCRAARSIPTRSARMRSAAGTRDSADLRGMCVALPGGVSCRVGSRPRCSAGIWPALLALAAAPGPSPAQESASDSPAPAYVDSLAWQARFESLVEAKLVREQLGEASHALGDFDPDRVLLVLAELEEDQLVAQRGPAQLPEGVVPRMAARGVRGAALEAARIWGKGDRLRALEMLRAPALRNDAQAVHLRAQLLDELSAGLPPLYRLGVVSLYREALLLDRDDPAAGRARVRAAQILLELGQIGRARAELEPHVDRLPRSEERRVGEDCRS